MTAVLFRLACSPYYRSAQIYAYKCELKNMLGELTRNILSKLYSVFKTLDLTYENPKTILGNMAYEAAFYIKNANRGVTKSVNLCTAG